MITFPKNSEPNRFTVSATLEQIAVRLKDLDLPKELRDEIAELRRLHGLSISRREGTELIWRVERAMREAGSIA